MLAQRRDWLRDFSWDFIVGMNGALCAKDNRQTGPTSDGFSAAKTCWEGRHKAEMSLVEAADLCFECHRLGPFIAYNGNTFAAVALRASRDAFVLETPVRQGMLRSALGHYIAGVRPRSDLERLISPPRLNLSQIPGISGPRQQPGGPRLGL